MYIKDDGEPGIDLAIGTLDQPNAVPPLSRQVGVELRVHWFASMFDLPELKTEDYRSADDMEKLRSLQQPDQD